MMLIGDEPQSYPSYRDIALWDAIGHIIDLFTPSECANYFAAAGYEPD